MCGIVGLFCKSPELEPRLGEYLSAMLVQMDDRGPDSAGVAVYRDPAPAGWSKLTLYSADAGDRLGARLGGSERSRDDPRARHAVVVRRGRRRRGRGVGARRASRTLRVMSAGRVIEIYKEVGRPRAFAERFRLADFQGTHGLGHTRMATESRVTTEGSHPFSTGHDLCLVHNGSLSNHNRLREQLRREGIEFQTENDTEVAAGVPDVAAARGRLARAGARGLPRRPRRLLHLPRRHGRRLRGAARPDRLQAGGARRDRRLGRDGVGVPRDRRAARRGRRADLGARAGGRLRLGEGARLMAVETAGGRGRRSRGDARCAS